MLYDPGRLGILIWPVVIVTKLVCAAPLCSVLSMIYANVIYYDQTQPNTNFIISDLDLCLMFERLNEIYNFLTVKYICI